MVLGLSSKNKKGASVHVDYLIHIHEIKPWPPSQSLRSLRSVVIVWENGERNSGSTNIVTPSLGSVIGEGKIEFNESFKLPVTLLRDASVRAKDSDTFLKNVLEFNLYEPRREKTHQLLATATVDLADYGILKDGLSIGASMNSKRSYRNTAQPVLFLTIQPIDRRRTNSSSSNGSKDVSKNGGESVSALMNGEYSEEAEIASFTDDDISSHSSLTVSSSTLESNGGLSARTEEEERERVNDNTKGSNHESPLEVKGEASNTAPERDPSEIIKHISSRSSSIDLSSGFSSPVDAHVSAKDAKTISSASEIDNNSKITDNGIGDSENEGSPIDVAKGRATSKEKGQHEARSRSFQLDAVSGEMDAEQDLGDDLENNSSQASDSNQDSFSNLGANIRADRLRNVKSVRSSSDLARISVVPGSSGSLKNMERKEAKVFPRDTREAVLENKVKDLESKVRLLEGELREAAAVEAALYSVIAEHGGSASKVHAPARRISRLYLYACKENPPSRRASAAKSAVSGIVLVAKACGNDVPRLTFWLSNSIVLRGIISQANREEELPVSGGPHAWKHSVQRETKKRQSPLKWMESPLNKKDSGNSTYEKFGNWDDPNTFTSALEKIEAWIFSRIVESIWWQTLTPRMQSAATRVFNKAGGSGSKKNIGRTLSSMNQEQGDFSMELWKKAFKDACERLCPLRASGHECGCLSLLARLIMEQCVARLDVAMFNAILRDSDDHIPTDPMSDPIGDPKVLPIPSGKSSFSAGAQLKNAIGNWSRWLADLFGIDDDDVVDTEVSPDNDDDDDERRDGSFKSFHLLNALSDLMMLPKDMLLNSSVRKEVCPTLGAPLIKKVLNNFVPDEFCPDPVPDSVLKALESPEPDEDGEESVTNYPCTAEPPMYSPPSATSIASIIGEFGSQSQFRRSQSSSVIRKSYTSDDELDELNSPLVLILQDTSQPTPPLNKTSLASKANAAHNAIRYELLRNIWMNSE